jgi:hypothetical protein
MAKQIDVLNAHLFATAIGVMQGKINTRHGTAVAKMVNSIVEGAHKASIHTRYQKAVPRIDLFDKTVRPATVEEAVKEAVDAKNEAVRNARRMKKEALNSALA